MTKILSKILLITVVALTTSFSLRVSAAMTGNVYKIDSDSINSGGTDESLSDNYQIADTVGEVATGESGSESYNIAAGYRQMDESVVTISSSVSDVIMLPALAGLSGGTSTGSTLVTVITDSPAGYLLTIRASDSPALRSSDDNFSDYVPSSSEPDYQLQVLPGQSVFAFTAEGSDVVSRYLDNGSSCGVSGGNNTTDRCWDGLTTDSRTISSGPVANIPVGTATAIKFSSGVGASRLQKMGNYTATTTVTAVAL